MPETVGLHICFDESGREIEVLDVTPVAHDKYRIEETPIFYPGITLGDIIRVKKKQGISYYVETVQKSAYERFAWLLSKEAASSPEIAALKRVVEENGGRYEQIFGGFLVIHMSSSAAVDVEAEMTRILAKFEL